MNYHVLPISDLKEHTEETTCECHPRIIFENGNMIIIHNAFDCRDLKEQLLDDLNLRSKYN
jgi:hypothetical protein